MLSFTRLHLPALNPIMFLSMTEVFQRQLGVFLHATNIYKKLRI